MYLILQLMLPVSILESPKSLLFGEVGVASNTLLQRPPAEPKAYR